MRSSKRLPLGKSLIFFILVPVVIAFLAMTTVSYVSFSNTLENEVKTRLATETEKIDYMLSAWFIEKEVLMADVVHKDEICTIMSGEVDAGDRGELVKLLKEDQKMVDGIYNLFVGLPDGQIIDANETDWGEGFDIRERSWYKKAADSEQIQYTDVYIDAATGKPVVTMSQAIKNQGKLIGVAGIDVSVDTLQEMLKNTQVGENGFACLMDAAGAFIYHPLYEVGEESNIFKIENGAYQQLGKKVLVSEPVLVTEQVREEEYFVSSAPVFQTGWVLAMLLPESEGLAPVDTTGKRLVTIGLAFLAVILLVLIIFIRHLRSILKEVGMKVGRIADGELVSAEEDVIVDDELGQLEKGFNTMKESLRDMVKNIRVITEQTVANAHEVSASAEESARAGQEVAQASETTLKVSEEQMRSLDEMTAIVDSTDSDISMLAELTDKMTELAKQSSFSSIEGEKLIEQATRQMKTIGEYSEMSHASAGNLENSWKQIENIIILIKGIAGQTNLLALNAAIEAARAGEHGHGFAVVADEIRKLAAQTQDSLSEITKLVQQSSADITQVVKAIDDSDTAVNNGINDVREAQNSFVRITEAIKELSSKVSEVDQSLQRLAEGSKGIVTQMEDIKGHSHRAAQQAQEVSAAVEEQAAGMEEIASASNAILTMIQELEESVARFKL